MKTRFRKTAVFTVVLTALCLLLTACGFLGGNNNGNTGTGTGGVKIYVNIYDVTGYSDADFIDGNRCMRIPSKDPTKTGYDFVGWYLDSEYKNPIVIGQKAPQTVNIYPLFKVKKLSVIIRDEQNDETKMTVEYGAKLDLSQPSAPGYRFLGWFTDKECEEEFDSDTAITSETVIYVGWKRAEYEIAYIVNGNKLDAKPDKYKIGDILEFPEPTLEDYIFEGWYLEPDFHNKVTNFIGMSGDKTLYARFLCDKAEMLEVNGLSEKTGNNEFRLYTDYSEHSLALFEFFKFSDGAHVVVKDGAKTVQNGVVALRENSETSGVEKIYEYTFTVTSESSLKVETFTVKVHQYDMGTVTVAYFVDGNRVSSSNVSRGGTATPYVYEGDKKGYVFDYWEKNGAEYNFDSPIVDNLTLEAVFKPIEYGLTFSLGVAELDGETPSVYTVESPVPAAPTMRYGYSFEGWYLDCEYSIDFEGFDALEELGSVTLYARYGKQAYWNFAPTGTAEGRYNIRNEEGDIVEVHYSAPRFELSDEEYPKFLDYCLFMKYDCVAVATDNLTLQGDDYFTSAGEYTIDHSMTKITLDDVVLLYFEGYIDAVNVSETGTYTQKDFVEFARKGSREADFNDFAIEHVSETVSVRSGEELYFMLEKGYRPIPVEGSIAEQVYTEIKSVLREIIGSDFTEKEKVVAISEYLVKTVAYDNAALTRFGGALDSKEVKTYRCFTPEGAIIDKIAVCDGISKAFSAMCAVEGVECIRVNGVKAGTPHAWNKVCVDLDGDGNREWSVVDCTAANTGVSSDGIEIINHSFIFTTDDMIVEKNLYVYDAKWEGVGEAVFEYDIYSDMYLGENDLVIDTHVELVDVLREYRTMDKASVETVLDICVLRSLVYTADMKIDSTAFVEAGYGVSDIGSLRPFAPEARDDAYIILTFFFAAR